MSIKNRNIRQPCGATTGFGKNQEHHPERNIPKRNERDSQPRMGRWCVAQGASPGKTRVRNEKAPQGRQKQFADKASVAPVGACDVPATVPQGSRPGLHTVAAPRLIQTHRTSSVATIPHARRKKWPHPQPCGAAWATACHTMTCVMRRRLVARDAWQADSGGRIRPLYHVFKSFENI